MYRPQFPFTTPPKCEDQRCVYSYDSTNTPFLAGTLAAGANINRIPLQLDKDADFYIRAISTTDTGLGITWRLEDPKGHPLSDTENAIQYQNYEFPEFYSTTDGFGIVTLDNADDWGIFCQQGSKLLMYLFNNGLTAIDLTTLCFNLHGVKRYSGDKCAP